MQDRSRLVIFDVDGTLVDSQASILSSISEAFSRTGLKAPSRAEALGIVGLSLVEAMATLVPDAGPEVHLTLAAHYRDAHVEQRERGGAEAAAPLYPGARDAVLGLDRAGWALSIATGKARRGLEHFLLTHGLKSHFITTQCADDAPSKPHPQMVLNCLAVAGVDAGAAVMIGDTEFDMAMARAAGCRRIGVAWGYHSVARLREGGAEQIIESFDELEDALDMMFAPA